MPAKVAEPKKSGDSVTRQLRVPARLGRRVAQVVEASGNNEAIELRRGSASAQVPTELLDLLRMIARATAAGQTVTVTIADTAPQRELSSQAVADLLNVSRPYVVKLARDGVLPHRMVGNRHRFREADVVAYQKQLERQRRQALTALAPAEGYRPDDF